MYSLFVSGDVREHSEGTFNISLDRFLESTTGDITSLLSSLSIEAIDCISSWPCVLMQEGRGQEKAFVTKVTDLRPDGVKVVFNATAIPHPSVLYNDTLWKIRTALDIEQFEFNRNHWSVKGRNLFAVLASSGIQFDSTAVSLFENHALPVVHRAELINTIDVIAEWKHTDIDRFLLESGVYGLGAPRVLGRQDRAQAIVTFAIENPSAKTAEGHLLSSFILQRVKQSSTAGNYVDVWPSVAGPKGQGDRKPEAGSLAPTSNRVFVVHGQNVAARNEIVAFLSGIGLQGIVLHEQPNMGRHLLTKFIDEAALIPFAIVLMTDDDLGGPKSGGLKPRARQNVILELGYFLAHLGQKKICALITPELETPSDFDGIVYVRMDGSERWKAELRRELMAAGMPVIDLA